jgi:hypothetical protein
MFRSRVVGSIAAGVVALTVTGCASIAINSYTERGADFAQYLTFAWAPFDDRSTGDPRLDNNPFFFDALQSEVDGQLIRRGYVRVKGGTPDLRVQAYVKIRQEVQSNGVEWPAGYSPRHAAAGSVQDAGTLWIEITDTASGNVAWRGWAEGTVEGLVDNQVWLEQKVGEIVSRILEKFPARPIVFSHDP